MEMAAVDTKKLTKGRQKIQMRLIEDKEDRVITFSKRKAGIFKKASEISVMCGAKVLFILFSPVGKAYSFGHPSVKSVADKFLGREESDGGKQIRQILENHLNKRLQKLVLHHFVAKSELEAACEQVSALAVAMKFENKGWWEANVSAMSSREEVEQVMKSLSDFEVALTNHFGNIEVQNAGQGSNSNIQPEDVNNFPQMTSWTGGNNLPDVGALGGFESSFGGVSDAGLAAVGYGGALGQGSDGFSLPAAGNYGGVLGQDSGFSLPTAGNYGGFPGQGNDNFSLPVAGNHGGFPGQGNDNFSLPAAGNYGGTLGQDNSFSWPDAGNHGNALGLGTGFSLPAAGNYGGALGHDNVFSLTVAGNYGGALGHDSGFSLPDGGTYGGALGQGSSHFSLPAGGYGGTPGQGSDHFNFPAVGYGGSGFSVPATGYGGTAGPSEGSSSGGTYNGGNFGAGLYGAGGYGGSFMDGGAPDPASDFQRPY
uniref:MADS-box domain-containing protein n=1 Tax=Kalanchoe fedtschenkoi TaxID=63787 RepID=A0A7N0UG22_KALFE